MGGGDGGKSPEPQGNSIFLSPSLKGTHKHERARIHTTRGLTQILTWAPGRQIGTPRKQGLSTGNSWGSSPSSPKENLGAEQSFLGLSKTYPTLHFSVPALFLETFRLRTTSQRTGEADQSQPGVPGSPPPRLVFPISITEAAEVSLG